MPQDADTKKPGPVPGDAEAPPRSEADRTARDAVNKTDRTEPTQTPQSQGKKPG